MVYTNAKQIMKAILAILNSDIQKLETIMN